MATTTAAESTIPGVSGVLTRGLAAQVNHAFRRWLTATGTFAFWLDDYEGSPRVDKRYATSALLTYKAAREFWLKAKYRHEWRTSNIPGNDYAAWCCSGSECSDDSAIVGRVSLTESYFVNQLLLRIKQLPRLTSAED